MAITLSRQTAQKIVETVKNVCGYDINFINTGGIIFASTNESRIGDYHEIGRQAAATGQTIEVDSDDSFRGTQKGVNIPFVYNREVIAAIGISGDPEEVRQYAVLAQKITSLILREQEIDSLNYGKKNQLNYVVRSLIGSVEISHEYLMEFLAEKKLDPDMFCRTILVRLHTRYHLSNLSLIENQIYRTFDQMEGQLYTFNFPNEYILILPGEQYRKWSYMLTALAEKYRELLCIGIGNSCQLERQQESCQAARIALKSIKETGTATGSNLAVFDDLDLEILLGCVTGQAMQKFLDKTVNKLNREDRILLQTYFERNMSLKETAEQLFIHKNTLQYQLNRVETKTGYNPRNFRDAVRLYLALCLEE